jgi:hypothetical protein
VHLTPERLFAMVTTRVLGAGVPQDVALALLFFNQTLELKILFRWFPGNKWWWMERKKRIKEVLAYFKKQLCYFTFPIMIKTAYVLKPDFNCLIDIFTLNFSHNYRTKIAWFKLLANDPYITSIIASFF